MLSKEQLLEIQDKQLLILKTVANICEHNNIKYWLDGGTLLGAVRHGGYIPWDDDIDIGVIRKDYNKLLKILPKELPENLVLQTSKTDKNYKYDWAKVRDKYSKLIGTSNIVPKHKYQGLRIDIFAFDYVPKYQLLQKSQVFYTKFRRFVRKDIEEVNSTSRMVKAIHSIANIIPSFLIDIPYNLMIHLSNLLCSQYISCYFQTPYSYPRNVKPVNCYFPLTKITFNNIVFNAPSKINCYLTKLFGKDYMTPVKYPVHVHGIEYMSENNVKE